MGKSWITLVICAQLIIQIINFVPTTMALRMPDSSGTKQYSISISSELKSGQLKLRCRVFGRSNGTSRGDVEQVLEPGERFGWDFKLPEVQNPWLNFDTSYHCKFEWNDKNYNFTIWRASEPEPCGEVTINWAVFEDGFYFLCGKDNWQKQYTWGSIFFIPPHPPASSTVEEGTERHFIVISSGLKTGQLKVQCKSHGTIDKEDVEQVIEPGKSFGWNFEVEAPWLAYHNYYYCNFEWNGKKVDLSPWGGAYGGICLETTRWAVLEDGFYYRCVGGERGWEKRFSWEGDIHLGPSLDNAH